MITNLLCSPQKKILRKKNVTPKQNELTSLTLREIDILHKLQIPSKYFIFYAYFVCTINEMVFISINKQIYKMFFDSNTLR